MRMHMRMMKPMPTLTLIKTPAPVQTPADKCHVRKGDTWLTFDLGTQSLWFSVRAHRYTFRRDVAEKLAVQHGGEVVDYIAETW